MEYGANGGDSFLLDLTPRLVFSLLTDARSDDLGAYYLIMMGIAQIPNN